MNEHVNLAQLKRIAAYRSYRAYRRGLGIIIVILAGAVALIGLERLRRPWIDITLSLCVIPLAIYDNFVSWGRSDIARRISAVLLAALGVYIPVEDAILHRDFDGDWILCLAFVGLAALTYYSPRDSRFNDAVLANPAREDLDELREQADLLWESDIESSADLIEFEVFQPYSYRTLSKTWRARLLDTGVLVADRAGHVSIAPWNAVSLTPDGSNPRAYTFEVGDWGKTGTLSAEHYRRYQSSNRSHHHSSRTSELT